jgi:hypothetical protein
MGVSEESALETCPAPCAYVVQASPLSVHLIPSIVPHWTALDHSAARLIRWAMCLRTIMPFAGKGSIALMHVAAGNQLLNWWSATPTARPDQHVVGCNAHDEASTASMPISRLVTCPLTIK